MKFYWKLITRILMEDPSSVAEPKLFNFWLQFQLASTFFLTLAPALGLYAYITVPVPLKNGGNFGLTTKKLPYTLKVMPVWQTRLEEKEQISNATGILFVCSNIDLKKEKILQETWIFLISRMLCC